MWIRGSREKGESKNIRKGVEGRRRKVWWTEQGKREFVEKFGVGEMVGNGVQEEWSGLKGRIKEALGGMERREGSRGKNSWWNEKCRDSKERVRKALRRWRKEGGAGEEYKQEKGRHKKLCDKKKGREAEEWQREVGEVKSEG